MARWLSRNLWLCPLAAIVVVAIILVLFGMTWTTAIIAALLFVCPAILIWGFFAVRRRPAKDGPHTSDREHPK